MRVTLEDARIVAGKLKDASPHIRYVELFGSVLRDGHGHDIDLIFIVDEKMARVWWSSAAEELRVRMGTRWLWTRRLIKKYTPILDELFIRTRKKRRQARASEILGFDIAKLSNDYKQGLVLDVFLLPENWREGHRANVSVLCDIAALIKSDEETRLLWERVARVAIRLA